MSLVVSGLSHHTSSLELRERVVFDEKRLPAALSGLRKQVQDAGVVILSTCNRSEIYMSHAGAPADLHHELRAFLCEWHGIEAQALAPALYEHGGRDVVGHLFRVASSLDSLVVGEQQILGQVHDAYLLAQSEQATDKVINALFQKAFTIAKRVRSQSNIGAGKVSIPSVAVDLAVSIFMNLAGKTVMVIGSGEMAELTLKTLVERGAGSVIVVNRSIENAAALATEHGGAAAALDDIAGHLHRADIVISSTSAPGYVLDAGQLQQALRRRGGEPMLVIDIAVPRDVEPAANGLDNIYLYSIDDLQVVADRNLEARRAEIDRCMEIVESGVDQFSNWLNSLAAEPTIVSLSKELNEIRERELEKTLARLKRDDLSADEMREEIDYMTKRIVNNILQQPLTQLKNEVHHEDHPRVLKLVQRLFGLKEGA